MRSFPEIWDESHVSFKDSGKKMQLWRTIKSEMEKVYSREFQEFELQRAWKYLRDSYHRKRMELREFVARSSGSASSECIEAKKKSWAFYEAMEYMDPVDEQGIRYCTTLNVSDISSADHTTEDDNDGNDNDNDSDNDIDIDVTSCPSETGTRPGSRQVQHREQHLKLPQGASQILPHSGRAGAEPLFYHFPLWGKKTRRNLLNKGEEVSALDDLAEVLRENEKVDRFEVVGMGVAAKLRKCFELDRVVGEQWMLKMTEFELELSRDIYEMSASNARK